MRLCGPYKGVKMRLCGPYKGVKMGLWGPATLGAGAYSPDPDCKHRA